jgi:hypothetical protein
MALGMETKQSGNDSDGSQLRAIGLCPGGSRVLAAGEAQAEAQTRLSTTQTDNEDNGDDDESNIIQDGGGAAEETRRILASEEQADEALSQLSFLPARIVNGHD